MRTGRSAVTSALTGDALVGVTCFVDFRLRFGVVGEGAGGACFCPPVVRRLDLATVGDTSTETACLRRVFVVGKVCGVAGRLRFDETAAIGVVLFRLRLVDFGVVSLFSVAVSICSLMFEVSVGCCRRLARFGASALFAFERFSRPSRST